MPPKGRSAREIILARRALFLASALHGVTAQAQEHPDDPWTGAEPAPVPPQEPTEPPPVPVIAPRPCLEPPRPTERPDRNAVGLVIGAAPVLLVPLYQRAAPLAFGATLTAGVQRQVARLLDVALLATATPARASGELIEPVGGTLRLSTTALGAMDYWDSEYAIVSSLEVGGGTVISRSSAGPNDHTWAPTRGPWLSVGATPFAFRWTFDRKYAFDLGVPIALVFSQQRSSNDDRFAPAYFTIGIGGTFHWELRPQTHSPIPPD